MEVTSAHPEKCFRIAQHMIVSSFLSCVRLFEATGTVVCEAPLCMEFSRQEYWGEVPFPIPGDLPDPGIEPQSLVSRALAGRVFTSEPSEKPHTHLPQQHSHLAAPSS